MKYKYDENRKVGEESSKSYIDKIHSGFFDMYMAGWGAEIGYSGYLKDIVPILENCDGYDLNTPGYDGRHIPVPDAHYDWLYSSHVLEHIQDADEALQEWFRVVKVGGHIIIIVPHKFLYEKKLNPPSRWNGDHKRFYTPEVLMWQIEHSFEHNTYRIRMLCDDDFGFDYSIPPEKHSGGRYEVICVVQKITKPNWEIT